jgi:hypothetical protein
MKPLRILVHAVIAVALAGTLCAGTAWAQTEGPSLGELARKKKKDDKKSTHVYSDENLPKAGADFGGTSTVGSSSAPASGAGSAAGAAEGTGAAAATASGGAEEGAKSGEPSPDAAAAQQKLETAKQDEQALRNNIKKLEDQLAAETKPNRRDMYQTALENAQANLAEFIKKREGAEKEVAAAEAAGKKKKKPAPAQPAPEETPQ